MAQGRTAHPEPAQLEAFALGRLSPDAQARTERHVAECDLCCARLRQVPDDALVAALRAADPRQTLPDGVPKAPVPSAAIPKALVDHPRYRILKVLGEGGMGVVYRAEHRLMERPVALKVIRRGLVRNAMAVERFRQEVRAAAKLTHPNIVTAFDAEEAGGLHFLVMEYVDGITLAKLVEMHGALSVVPACHYVRQAAQGLRHAHERGMVHRDLKPQNLMLNRKGQVKIMDFGLARLAQETDAEDAGRITREGMLLGTPDYMAPEQAGDSRSVDIRADLYSLGCTLYYLLIGRVPFPGGSAVEKMLAHMDAAPAPLAELRGDLPPGLVPVVERMMAKDPAQRYQTPAEVVQALAPFIRTAPAETDATRDTVSDDNALAELRIDPEQHVPPPPSSKGWVFGVGTLALIGLVLAWLGNSGHLGPRPQEAVAQAPRPAPRNVPRPEADRSSARLAAAPAPVPATARPRKRVALLLASSNFWYPDYAPVRRVLQEGGVDVVVVSSALGMARPQQGLNGGGEPVPVDLLVGEARADDFDALVIVGGIGVTEYFGGRPHGAAARRLIVTMYDTGKLVTALCLGPAVLADAGVLRHRRAVAYDPAPQKLRERGAVFVDEPVVVDLPFITGRDWRSAEAFAETLLKYLNENEKR